MQSKQVSMSDFLRLMSACIVQLSQGSSASISIKTIKSPEGPSENINDGRIEKAEYIDMSQRIKGFCDSNGVAPNYVRTSIGELRFENTVYIYSKILNFYKANNYLPNYVNVVKWKENTPVDPSLDSFTKPSASCQSDDNEIISSSRNIASGSNYYKAVRIFNWVRDNVGYSFYYDTQYGALGTLRQKSGNCCDQTHLLVALCRASGVPAKYVHGDCTFSSGNRYGHVWTQVNVDNKWYTADAISSRNTFGVINNWNTGTATIHGYYRELPF